MKKRMYSDKEIEILKQCSFVNDVKYGNQIEYDPIFKVWCIMMKFEKPDLSAREIFERAGMNTDILHKDIPRKRISYWMYLYKRYGIKYFFNENDSYTITDEFKKKLFNCIKDKLNEIF